MANRNRPKNFDEVCRLCLEHASDTNILFPLFINEAKIPGFYGRFLKEFKESIPEVISACIGIEIDPTTNLPLNICTNCEKQLIASNQFRQKCWQSNEYLLQLQRNETDDNFDTDDDMPLDSIKYPELILVDRLKDEFKQEDVEETDSSCDSAWNNYDDDNFECKTTRKDNPSSSTKTESEIVIQQKTAVKRSTTIPLVTPSMPIVSENCDQAMDCNKSESSNPPKRPIKYTYQKKPKMCTVCGVIVDRLRDHMRTHPDALEYCCTICSKKYLTKKGLVKHMKHKHNEDSSNENKINDTLGDEVEIEDDFKRNLWQSNLRKRLRQMGETYIAVDGTEKTGRSVKSMCPKSCYRKCQSNIGEAQRLEIHKSFWKLTDNEKDRFYATNVKRASSVRKRTKAEHSQRSFTFTYFFDVNDSEVEVSRRVQVCQKFFIWTLDISKGRIYYYFQNIHDADAKGPRVGRHKKPGRKKTRNC